MLRKTGAPTLRMSWGDGRMLDLTKFQLDFRPATYWPDGFRPVELETSPKLPRKMDPGGGVFQASDGSFHWVTFPDEVAIAEISVEEKFRLTARRDEDDAILYRFVGTVAAPFCWPPLARPMIERSREPLTLRELIFSLDNTTMSDRLMPSTLNIMAYLWAADLDIFATRTERMMSVNAAHVRSRVYPQLEAYYQAVGAHFVQTGELHELDEPVRLDDTRGNSLS